MQVVKKTRIQELKNKALKKVIFTLIFILYVNSFLVYGTSTNDTLQLKNNFKELIIRYEYGDESHIIEEMKFVNKGNKIIATISTIHSHVITEYISSTDICTLLLYKNYVEWNQHIVMSKKEVFIFNLKKESLFTMKRKAWEKIYNKEKK